ncbi:MAG TPA: M28 family peptidase [Spirochaetia bacterium]|nr:M28 family peptidase [Spirochaetia bacterium]
MISNWNRDASPGEPALRSHRGEELLRLVEWQLDFGCRYPGSEEHRIFREALSERLCRKTDLFYAQDFTIGLRGERVGCANLIGVLQSKTSPNSGPLLLGTHFDTRVRADREYDESLRQLPIPGANDGGSGTGVLLHILDSICTWRFSRDIHIVLFDAEDVGDIDGNHFSMGARYLAGHPLPLRPEEVIILDMVGGSGMILNQDAHIYHHEKSRILTEKIFCVGQSRGMTPFIAPKRNKIKYIVSDHIPFLLKGIPSCILIDIDYPQWHTRGDLLQALSSESLLLIEDLLLEVLSWFRVG